MNGSDHYSQLLQLTTAIVEQEPVASPGLHLRAAVIAWELAGQLDVRQDSSVFFAAMLRDIGLASCEIPRLQFPTLSSQITNPRVFDHPARAAKIIRGFVAPGLTLTRTAEIVYQHHEWWNGSGYPRGNLGTNIQPEAQCLRLADSFDILLQLHPDWDMARILTEMKRYIWIEYSRQTFDAFAELLESSLWPVVTSPEAVTHAFEVDLEEVLSIMEASGVTDPLVTFLCILSEVVDSKFVNCQHHSYRVSRYAMQIAKSIGLSVEEIRLLHYSALVHDVGKTRVPRAIIEKPTRLTSEEYATVQQHPENTVHLLASLRNFETIREIAWGHHERFDGMGYPRRLSHEAIHHLSRVLTIADAFDAMTSVRTYQRVRTRQEAYHELLRCASSQFDPQLVEHAQCLLEPLLPGSGDGESSDSTVAPKAIV